MTICRTVTHTIVLACYRWVDGGSATFEFRRKTIDVYLTEKAIAYPKGNRIFYFDRTTGKRDTPNYIARRGNFQMFVIVETLREKVRI